MWRWHDTNRTNSFRESRFIFSKFSWKNKYSFYDFVDETEEVSKDSVSGFYDVDELEDTQLYAKVPQGYELIDDSEDEDYECSDDDESEDDISLVDENEDDEEEEA